MISEMLMIQQEHPMAKAYTLNGYNCLRHCKGLNIQESILLAYVEVLTYSIQKSNLIFLKT